MTKEKSKLTAALLAIFLGGIGAHLFYLGKKKYGILYLVFVWTYIPSILGIIDGITYLRCSDEKFQKKYVEGIKEEKMQYKTDEKKKKIFRNGLIIAGIILLLILLNTLSSKNSTTKNTDLKTNSVNNKNFTSFSAEAIMDEYLSLANYNGIIEAADKFSKKKELTGEFMKEAIESDEKFFSRNKAFYTELTRSCSEFMTLFNYDICKLQNITQISSILNLVDNKVNIISKKLVKDEDNEKRIAVEIENNKNKTESYIYLLKKETNGWKIVDYIDTNGKLLSETLDIDKVNNEREEFFKPVHTYFSGILKILNEGISEQKETNSLKIRVINGLVEEIPSERLKAVNVNRLKESDTKYAILIAYIFEDRILVDNYLQVTNDATKVFQILFPLDRKIENIQVDSIEKVKDDYGNIKERYLAKTTMNRATYNKINWQGFEYKNLGNIANVNFYGDSLYKSLTDWEDSYNDWNMEYSTGSSNIGIVSGAPASMCGDVKNECRDGGDCETYNQLRAFGVCS